MINELLGLAGQPKGPPLLNTLEQVFTSLKITGLDLENRTHPVPPKPKMHVGWTLLLFNL